MKFKIGYAIAEILQMIRIYCTRNAFMAELGMLDRLIMQLIYSLKLKK